MARKLLPLWIGALAAAALVACGGGGGSTGTSADTSQTQGTGTLRLSLTDAPACGYDHAWVTVQKVRVHRSATAADGDAGWVDIALPQPLRVDLLTLTNGTLVPLGQTELPAGTYTQMRLVLADNGNSAPYSNAVVPTGGGETPLTTPSGQQSGLKMNVKLEVPAGQVADFAIDFDGCKSFVTAGKSGKILLKPVLSVIPMLSPAGQTIRGWLHPSLATAEVTVSVQSGGEVVRATPPMQEPGGNLSFVLYPVPVGTYNLVVTANGYATAVVSGVPAYASQSTTVNNVALPILPPTSNAQRVSGVVSVGSGPNNTVDTGGVVRALQLLAGGPTIEVASANARADDGYYQIALPFGAPVKATYVAGATSGFVPDMTAMANYRLAATATGFATPTLADITLGVDATVQNFVFP
jgi:hypothetical protein